MLFLTFHQSVFFQKLYCKYTQIAQLCEKWCFVFFVNMGFGELIKLTKMSLKKYAVLKFVINTFPLFIDYFN